MIHWHTVSYISLPISPRRGYHYPELIPCHLFYFHSGIRTVEPFLSSRQPDDLNKAILFLTKEIYIPLTRDTPSSSPNIIQTFYYLTVCLFFRAMESKRPEDVKCCITYLRYLHGQWHGFSMKFPVPVTTVLVHILVVQVDLKLEDMDRDIEEMADLCDELLNSDISMQFLIGPIEAFAHAIHLHKGPDEVKILSETVTNCLRKAVVRLPDLHDVPMLLSQYLYFRFDDAHSDDDYEEGMAILDRIITFRGPGDEPSPYRQVALEIASLLASSRFLTYGKPEHLEHAIYRRRAFVDATSIEDPDHASRFYHLSQLEGLRLDGTANTRDALLVPPESGKVPSFRELIAAFPGPMPVKPAPIIIGASVSEIDQVTDLADIKDGIEYFRLLLISYPRNELAIVAHGGLGMSLNRAFQLTHEIGYLNEAISSTRDGVDAVGSISGQVTLVNELIRYLSTRLELLRHEEDLHELMQRFPTSARNDIAFSCDGHPRALV